MQSRERRPHARLPSNCVPAARGAHNPRDLSVSGITIQYRSARRRRWPDRHARCLGDDVVSAGTLKREDGDGATFACVASEEMPPLVMPYPSAQFARERRRAPIRVAGRNAKPAGAWSASGFRDGADRVRFELTVRFHVHTLSRRAP